MEHEQFYVFELLGLLIASGLLVGAVFISSPRMPGSEMAGLRVIGQGAITIASLMIIFSIYLFRENLNPTVFHLFFLGFAFLYLSTLLDFINEFRTIPDSILPVQGIISIVGAISLVGAFGHWLNQYENRGEKLTETENALSKRTQQLTLLNRIIQHDLRNDLNVINGRIQIAQDHVDSDGTDHLEQAHRSAMEAIDLTRTARDFMETLGQESRDLHPISLEETVESQISRVRKVHPEANLRFEDRPEEQVSVLADEMLSSVFRNLLMNGILHNDKETPEVLVSAAVQGETVRVRVADNGPGVPESEKDGIFGRGEKGLESSGTGIGLYLVHTLTAEYGGSVRVMDNEPDGAVFVVELPRA